MFVSFALLRQFAAAEKSRLSIKFSHIFSLYFIHRAVPQPAGFSSPFWQGTRCRWQSSILCQKIRYQYGDGKPSCLKFRVQSGISNIQIQDSGYDGGSSEDYQSLGDFPYKHIPATAAQCLHQSYLTLALLRANQNVPQYAEEDIEHQKRSA